MTATRSPAAVVDDVRALVAQNVARTVEVVAGAIELARKVRTSEIGRAPLPPPEVFGRIVLFNLAFADELSKLVLGFANGVLTAAERAIVGEVVPSSPGHADGRIEIRARGRQGERVECPFVVEHEYDHGLDVSFVPGPLVGADGSVLPATLISFEPPKLTVPPRGLTVGRAVVDVTPNFVVGQTYSSTIRLVGFEGREVALSLSVVASEGPTDDGPDAFPAAAGPPLPARARPRRERRARSVDVPSA